MLDVFGLAVIPQDPQYKEIKTNSGYYLDFNIVSQSRDMGGQLVYHKYRANMWIPDKEVDDWRNKIEPGSVFKFVGKWSAESREGSKFPINILKLEAKQTTPLKTPLWLEDKQTDKKER